MKKNVIKEAVKEAIAELMATPEGRNAFGPVMFDAVGQYINSYALDLEKHHTDGTIERVKENGDILSFIAKWISQTEGAIRGVQSDAAQARNRAAETRDMTAWMIDGLRLGTAGMVEQISQVGQPQNVIEGEFVEPDQHIKEIAK